MNQLPTESSSLLCHPVINETSLQNQQKSSCSCKHLCLPSKAAILMIFWTAAVGMVYNLVLLLAVALVYTRPLSISSNISLSINDYLPYAILAFVSMLYPLSGFIADVCCGRLKVFVTGLCFILTFVLLVCLSEIILLVGKSHSLTTYTIFHQTKEIIVFSLVMVSLIIFVIGLASYQANLVQLGLDQLFEAPSQYLSLFILYASWAFKLGSVPVLIFVPLLLYNGTKQRVATVTFLLSPFIMAGFLIFLLIIGWWK